MNRNNILFPLSIVIIALIIAGGIMFSRREYKQPELPAMVPIDKKIDVQPISNTDHVLGNPDAQVLIVEYSDFECPACKEFHPIMQRVIDEYGKKGEVAWVYRHFPIEEVHANALGAAKASECVADVGGAKKFWDFADIVFDEAPNSLLPENLRRIATSLEIDDAKYDACLLLNKFDSKINSDIADGKLIYHNDASFGTPYIIITSKSGIQTQISGVQEYEDLVEIIEAIK